MVTINSRSIFAVLVFSAVSISALMAPNVVNADKKVVNIYSARKEQLILPLLERFQQDTGIGFQLVTGKAGELIKRLEAEGDATPADVMITVDAGNLHRAKEARLLQPMKSEVAASAVPENLRDKDWYWTGLSQRARTIIFAPDRVDASKLSTYEDLTNSEWAGRVCIRSSSNIYNQSLVASMIAANGEEATLQWATEFVKNFARPPTGGDTDQLRAVAAGECDLAVTNTYYFGRLNASKKPKDQEVAAALKVFWPNQGDNDRGTHVNISGIGVTAHAKNYDSAIALIEYLYNEESQNWYAQVNHEYPVVADIPASAVLQAFGDFNSDNLNLTILGTNNQIAVKIMDQAGWK